MKRIYIIGNSWSGKSYLAKTLSKKFSIPNFDLDDIFWEQKYIKKRSEKEKKIKLSKLIKENKYWIIEWVFTSFTDDAVKNATDIVRLDINIFLLIWRVLKRDFKKIIHWKHKLNYTLSLISFIKDYKKLDTWYYYKTKHLLEKHKVNYTILKNRKEVKNYLQKIFVSL
jgi:adenylate kinase family enzyme